MSKDLMYASELLEKGEVVALPTETVYGLGANALNREAVEKIFKIKERPLHNPLILHVGTWGQVLPLVAGFPDVAKRLAKHFWPGPLTMVLPKSEKVPDIVTAGGPNVAIRIPSHPLTKALLSQLPFPIAAPSANLSTQISPTCASHVAGQLGNQVAYILDGGPCLHGLESTIVGFQGERVIIYRKGSIAKEQLEEVLGQEVAYLPTSKKEKNAPTTPGRLSLHYAPKTLLRIGHWQEEKEIPKARIGWLAFQAHAPNIPKAQQVILSPKGDLAEAGRHLFGALHYLDSLGLAIIWAERFPERGLGATINDRLQRAAKRKK